MKKTVREKIAFRRLMRLAGFDWRARFTAANRALPARGDTRAERAACTGYGTMLGWLGTDVCIRMADAIGDDAANIFFAAFFDGEQWN